MPLLTTEVRNGRLELGSTGSFSTSKGITYTITAASLDGVEISGSGDVDAREIDAEAFDARISGSGKIEASGVAGSLVVDVSGSGNYSGEALVASVGEASVSGSGRAVVNVTDQLEASVSGSGNIEYLGDPEVDASTSGSGSVARR